MTAAAKLPSPKLLAAQVVRWFSAHQRDLPWRRTRDPYAIWISEIMLQQTQVQTVIPYFERWMRELPTVIALAEAPTERVLKLWEGLGYYRRARHAHTAAQRIVAEFHGAFPQNFAQVLSLPGIGRYTAGAICSLAFNAPTPVLDGNVIRVLTRVYDIEGNPRDKKVNTRLWQLAAQLVEAASDRSALNQGLMELGATICAPRGPRCEICPVRRLCAARRLGRQEMLPMLDKRPAATRRTFHAYIVRCDDRFLVAQRAETVVNGSLWEFPNAEIPGETSLFEILRPEPLCRIAHTITRYRILLEAFPARLAAKKIPPKSCWRTLDELEALPFPSAHRKIVAHLRANQAI